MPQTTSSIANNISEIKTLLNEFRNNSGQNEETVKVLAVSKGQSVEKMTIAWNSGIHCFGENYLQEALTKMREIKFQPEWHFIGPVQANKTRDIATHFSWVHSVDRIRVARRLSAARAGQPEPLNVCIQVNIDREESKSGVAPEAVEALAEQISELSGLRLRGLMVIPKVRETLAAQREPFRRTRELLENLKKHSPRLRSLDTLSMGMSADMAAALAEGATIVRVGTGIFGPRDRADGLDDLDDLDDLTDS